MSVFIKKFTLSGIKNIKNPLTITFLKNNILKRSDINQSNVKAIYGPNGSGKTAIVHGIDIMLSVLKNKDYLKMEYAKSFLDSVMNKNMATMHFRMEFVYFKEEKPEAFVYELRICKNAQEYVIDREVYSSLNMQTGHNNILFKSEKGLFVNHQFEQSFVNKFVNLLSNQSILTRLVALYFNDKQTYQKDVFKLLPFMILLSSVHLIFDRQDESILPLKKQNDQIKLNQLIINALANEKFVDDFNEFEHQIVTDKELIALRNELHKQEHFLKLFKPDIVSIEIDDKLIREENNKRYYDITTFINYSQYKVNLEYESTGIKKLYNLYQYIKKLSLGHVVVIDEIDAHINDVYLTDIIKFASEFTNGQLIFTTHNVSPMDVIKHKKYAIDFMSYNAAIESWKQIGNYSPSGMYKKGLINGLPFNLESEDFIEIFLNE